VATQIEAVQSDAGSFRDPSGGVLRADGRIYRYFRGESAREFRRLQDAEFFGALIKGGAVIPSWEIERNQNPALYAAADDAELIVEHPKVPFLSYCYEWPFEMLKAAAERQLQVTAEGLSNGYLVKDATPFNIQYLGGRPVFIDVASFEPYDEGASWRAYAQFCQMFLNPLLLQAKTGVPFQPWLRGSMDGIELDHLRSLLPFRSKLGKTVFLDVVLQSWLNHRFAGSERVSRSIARQKVPKPAIEGLLNRMRKQVAGLKRPRQKTKWSEYEDTKAHYSSAASQFKERFVREHVQQQRPELVWDLGCNRGEYSLVAAETAGYVVAMDSDESAIGALYERVAGKADNVLPLVIDLMNPSPDQGWAGLERQSLRRRGQPDYALCLALVHHLAIAGNVPLPMICRWLGETAPAGIVEFVPKIDPMVQRLLATRKDVYGDYTQERFEGALEAHFRVGERATLPESNRILYALGPR
jgi:SAM-dependent methyltransferase